MLAYPVKLTKDGDTILATCPDLPEVTTFGEDRDDALSHAVDGIEEAIAARIADREEIPPPSKGRYMVQLPTQTTFTVLLYNSMRRHNVSKAKLARTLHWHRPQVDRLLDLRHSTRLEQFDAAFTALGEKLEVRVK